MNWLHFQTKNEGPEKAFEAFCNQLFRKWSYRTHADNIIFFNVVNGSGGDGGVESYAELKNGDIIGLQAKWFPEAINSNKISNIRNSIITAKTVRPAIKEYIVCIPRTLSSTTAKKTKSGHEQQNERRRWTNLELEIKEKYPDLNLILWDEDRLNNELLERGAEGISKYWFEKEEISLISLKNRFELSKNGWLRERYVPSLNGSGQISRYINTQLGDPSDRFDAKEKLSKFLEKLEIGLNLINQFLQVYSPEIPPKYKKKGEKDRQSSLDFLKKLQQLKEELIRIKSEILELIDCVNYGSPSAVLERKRETEIHDIIGYLEKNHPRIEFSFLHHDLQESLKNISIDEISYNIDTISMDLLPYTLIFSGNPGTGKTHGLAHKVDQKLNDGFPAILIRAKDTSIRQGWGTVLRQELGLSGTWEEDEIWSALEGCASRSDVLRAHDMEDDEVIGNEATKVLICIDGLDEARDKAAWLEKIGEMRVIIKNHPHLRFCISGRPYAFTGSKIASKYDPYESIRNNIEKDGCFKVNIRSDGDVPVNKLFDAYVQHYHVDVSQAPWIRWMLSTPLALKLFCEIYHDSTIDPQQKIRSTVSNLLKEKIRRVDDELRIQTGDRWGIADNVTLMVLNALSDYFQIHPSISRSDALNLIIQAPRSKNLIQPPTNQKILDYLRDYGMLFEDIPFTTDILRPEEPIYQFAFEPLNDYLIAEHAVSGIISAQTKKLPSNMRDKPAAQLWAALILLSDHKILVGVDGYWTGDLSENELDDIRYTSLSQSYGNDLEKFQSLIERKIRKSITSCRKVISNLIIKVSRIEKHPLGPIFLHNVLSKFKTPAARDLIFSGPDYLFSDQEEIWSGWSENPVQSEKLLDSDSHRGMPLLFAWSLTSVDEKLRYNSRKELTTWGKANPQEFLKLLNLTFHTNDPQMREDLIQIASAIACLLDPKDNNLKNYAYWSLNEIFMPEKLEIYRDIIVRQAGRIICERAYLGGHIKLNQVKKSRPPFSVRPSKYPVDSRALVSDEKIPEPLSWDLSEYVLPYTWRGFFKEQRTKHFNKNEGSEWSPFSHDTLHEILSGKFGKIDKKTKEDINALIEEKLKRQDAFSKIKIYIDAANFPEDALNTIKSSIPKKQIQYPKKAEAFLKKYSLEYKIKKVSPRQLATAACIYYLKKIGWNEKQFHGKPNGGKPGEIIGADIAIIRAHGPASHGSRSSISSFAEKYVWCFVYEFTGYLADILEYYYEYPERQHFVNDYSQIFNLPSNPAQELLDTNLDSNAANRRFFLPNDLSSEPQPLGKDRLTNLQSWINAAPTPDFSPWILPEKEQITRINCSSDSPWLLLQLFTSITEPQTQGNLLVWINSFILPVEDLKLLLRDCSLKTTEIKQFVKDSINREGGLITAVSYLTPFDVLWMPWLEEDLEDIHLSFKNNRPTQYKTYNTILGGHYHSFEGEVPGERSYTLPSKMIRNLLEIKKGTSVKFCKQENSLEGFFYDCGTPFRDSQKMLFIKKDELLKKLKDNKYSIFWTIRLSRRSSMHALEEFPKMRDENDMHWVFLLEGNKSKLLEIDRFISLM